MHYALDTEFIDTPEGSHLISLGLASLDGRDLYLEFDYPEDKLTPWLNQNVVPHLTGNKVSFDVASKRIVEYCGPIQFRSKPKFWAMYGAYDWYWFCRIFGGMKQLPDWCPNKYVEATDYVGCFRMAQIDPQHNALTDAKALVRTLRTLEVV